MIVAVRWCKSRLRELAYSFCPLRAFRVPSSLINDCVPPKAAENDWLGRMREIISDPLNIAISRHPLAGVVDHEGFVVLHNGLKVPISGPFSYYEEFSTILAINRGVHEPLEEFVFQEVLRLLPMEPRMMELGAYWGHYSMWLKSVRPDAETILVEPDAGKLAAGRANFARNGVSGEFIRAFVGNDGFSVDRFLDERAPQSLDVLHADIQGFEVEMLRGCVQTLGSRSINFVFISTHSTDLHNETVALLDMAGYRVEVSCDVERETTSSDGFVFASNPNLEPVFQEFMPLGRLAIALAEPSDIVKYLDHLKSVKGGKFAVSR